MNRMIKVGLLFFVLIISLQATTSVEPGYGYSELQKEMNEVDNFVFDNTPHETKTESRPLVKKSEELPKELHPATPAPKASWTMADLPKDWNCDHIGLLHSGVPQDQLCNVVSTQPSCPGDFVNFYELYYCGFNASLTGLLVVYVFFIFLIFKYTAFVVDEYIVKGITIVSDALKFSEALAAVTLLALANGAGDVITALVAGSASGGVSYNIGALFGAGLFVAVCVVSACVFLSKEPLVFDKMIIYRDVAYLLLTTVVTLLFATGGAIFWWEAVIFLLIYVSMVVFVIVQEKMELKKLKDFVKGSGAYQGFNVLIKTAGATNQQKELKDKEEQQNNANKYAGLSWEEKGENNYKLTNERITSWLDRKEKEEKIVQGVGALIGLKKIIEQEEKETTFSDKGIFAKFMFVIEQPYEWLCWLTCCQADFEEEEEGAEKASDLMHMLTMETFNKTRSMVYPVTGAYFITWTFTKVWVGMVHLYLTLPLIVIFYGLFIYNTKNGAPGPKFKMTMTILAILAGLMWTYILVGILIDMLNTLGVLLGLDNTFLGLTILAVGNALPDALTTISLCGQGKAVMAISGGYAGQLFGILVGFGLSMLKVTLMNGPQTFDLFVPAKIQDNLLDIIVLSVAFVLLSFTILWGVFNKFVMTKTFATISVSTYAVFVLVCTILAVSKAYTNF